MPIFITQGDITQQSDDAIVNAANENLLSGGGVCGAIHRAAGPGLDKVCREIGRCPTGSAVITPGFALKAKHIIHAVGPRWLGGERKEAELLAQCYESIFNIAIEQGLSSVSVPAISTGIYHYPLEPATDIAIRAARRYQEKLRITFVCFDDRAHMVYKNLATSVA